MQRVFAIVSKGMVDSRNGSNLLYLPLDKLMQQSGVAGTTAAPAAPASEAAPASSASPVDVRSRDGQRGRDRDGR